MGIIREFNSKRPEIKLKDLPFSFYSLPIFLDYSGFLLERNGETLLTNQDPYYKQEFPSVFLPKKPINWEDASITFTSEEDLKKIKKRRIEILIKKPIGEEFFYKTESLLKPESKIERRIEQFKKSYKYKTEKTFSKNKIKDFYTQWKKQKKRTNDNFSEAEKFFFFCLDNLKKYKIKQVYVVINNKLVGFAWGVEHQSGNWAGLHLKVNYSYKGLSRFLHQERAKLFARRKFFTLGTGANESGIIQFKRELGPSQEKSYYYILTGKKLGK
jgi:hypothetical protein